MTRVTIVMPTLNSQQFIGDAISSICNQTYKNLNLLVIDGGSIDSTLEIVRQWARKDKRIKYYIAQGGLINQLNLGIDLTTTPFIARMDSDDIALSGRISDQLSFLINQNIQICGTGIKWSNNVKQNILYPQSDYQCKLGLSLGSQFAHPTILAETEVFKKNKYNIKAKYIEDFQLWCQMSLAQIKMGNCPTIGLIYRIHCKQITKTRETEHNTAWLNTIYQYLLKIHKIEPRFKLATDSYPQKKVLFCVESILLNKNLFIENGLKKEVANFLYSFIPKIDFNIQTAWKLAGNTNLAHFMSPMYIKLLSRCLINSADYKKILAILKYLCSTKIHNLSSMTHKK